MSSIIHNSLVTNDDNEQVTETTCDKDDIIPETPSLLLVGSANRFQVTLQLIWHLLLAAGIGVSLRLTTFTEATAIAASLGKNHAYTIKTFFLVSFGLTKAISNVVVGRASDLYGRKAPHAIGWLFGVLLGVALLMLLRNSATEVDGDTSNLERVNHQQPQGKFLFWYILANICLGAQQGWTWTTNIFMFLDILGPRHRALASSLSNSVGYLSAAVTTYIAATLPAESCFRIVLVTCLSGFLMAAFLVRDTSDYVQQEQRELTINHTVREGNDNHRHMSVKQQEVEEEEEEREEEEDFQNHLVATTVAENDGVPHFRTIFVSTCWRNPCTAILCAGGLTANLMTSLSWGLVLIWGHNSQLSNLSLANIGSAFTFAKGITMILSSYISDRQQNRKLILMAGFVVSIIGLGATATADLTTDLQTIYIRLLLGGVVLGIGIGSVYCVMTAALSDHVSPKDRASCIGVYKFWRDFGYAFGGLLTGMVADASGGSFLVTTSVVIVLVGLLVIGIGIFYQERIQMSDRTLVVPPRTEFRGVEMT